MLAENVNLFSKICGLANFFKSTQFHWNPELVCLTCSLSLKSSKRLKYRCYLHTAITVVVIVQTMFSVIRAKSSHFAENAKNATNVLVSQFQNGLASTVLVALSFHLHTSRCQATDVIHCVNGLLQFNKMYRPSNYRPGNSGFYLLLEK